MPVLYDHRTLHVEEYDLVVIFENTFFLLIIFLSPFNNPLRK